VRENLLLVPPVPVLRALMVGSALRGACCNAGDQAGGGNVGKGGTSGTFVGTVCSRRGLAAFSGLLLARLRRYDDGYDLTKDEPDDCDDELKDELLSLGTKQAPPSDTEPKVLEYRLLGA
jgi:hypothetical protein